GGLSGLALGFAEPDQQVAPLRGVRLAEQLERLAEPAHGFVGRQLLERALAGEPRVTDGFVRVDGCRRLRPMVCELAHSGPGISPELLLERFGDAEVKPRAPG